MIPTSKLRAKVGRAGAISPYPGAMTTLADSSTQMPRGMRLTQTRSGNWSSAAAVSDLPIAISSAAL